MFTADLVATGDIEKKVMPVVLIDPGIPKQAWGINPRTALGKKWWKQEKEKFKLSYCVACGKTTPWLDYHERYSYGVKKQTLIIWYEETIPLCKDCHNFIHSGRLLTATKITEVGRIRTRGIELLREANLLGVAKDYFRNLNLKPLKLPAYPLPLLVVYKRGLFFEQREVFTDKPILAQEIQLGKQTRKNLRSNLVHILPQDWLYWT